MNQFIPRLEEPLIKVCGIKTVKDALAAVEYGANALGFNFYPPSPRYLENDEAEMIISRLPEGILSFAVVVHGHDLDQVQETGDAGSVTASPVKSFYGVPDAVEIIQIHGLKDSREIPESDSPLLIAVSPETASLFEDFDIIVDTSWGEGRLADWDKTAGIDRPYILSGGLNPRNVREALETLSPAGIDVCSGVEASPGEKDHRKLKDFLETARDFYSGK